MGQREMGHGDVHVCSSVTQGKCIVHHYVCRLDPFPSSSPSQRQCTTAQPDQTNDEGEDTEYRRLSKNPPSTDLLRLPQVHLATTRSVGGEALTPGGCVVGDHRLLTTVRHRAVQILLLQQLGWGWG